MGHNSFYYTGQKYSINGHDYDAGGHEPDCWCGNGGEVEDDEEVEVADEETSEEPAS